jgi:hypothetical protein
MNDAPLLFQASVPVFRHYLGRVTALADRLPPEALAARLAGAAPAGAQFAEAAGFALRTVCPLAGREVPGLPGALAPRLAVARAVLGAVRPTDFDGAERREITHMAGTARLTQPAPVFLFQFGLPNFFFHLTMGYAALHAAGFGVDRGDFDGQHLDPRPQTEGAG